MPAQGLRAHLGPLCLVDHSYWIKKRYQAVAECGLRSLKACSETLALRLNGGVSLGNCLNLSELHLLNGLHNKHARLCSCRGVERGDAYLVPAQYLLWLE